MDSNTKRTQDSVGVEIVTVRSHLALEPICRVELSSSTSKMQQSKQTKFFQLVGGRKQFNGYIATLLLTIMAPFLQASFSEYSLGLLGALGLTSGLIAWEDRDGKKYSKKTKINAVSAGAQANGSNQELTQKC